MLMLALVMEKPVRGTVEIEYDNGSTQVIPAADLALELLLMRRKETCS